MNHGRRKGANGNPKEMQLNEKKGKEGGRRQRSNGGLKRRNKWIFHVKFTRSVFGVNTILTVHHCVYCPMVKASMRRILYIQLSPAIPDVKGPTNLICYWRIFIIANVGIKKK